MLHGMATSHLCGTSIVQLFTLRFKVGLLPENSLDTTHVHPENLRPLASLLPGIVASKTLTAGSKHLALIFDQEVKRGCYAEDWEDLACPNEMLLDLRSPASWYPAARQIKRTIIAHMGPTNSGMM